MNKNSLLRIRDLSKKELFDILDDAMSFSSTHADWQLEKRPLIANLFLNLVQEHIIHLHLHSIN